jgi:hypothetical protein
MENALQYLNKVHIQMMQLKNVIQKNDLDIVILDKNQHLKLNKYINNINYIENLKI